MISLGGVVELGKSLGMLSPVKLSAVDDNPANGGTMSTNPFGCRVNNDIRAVVKRSAEIPSGTECVVDLHALVLLNLTQTMLEAPPTTTGTPFSCATSTIFSKSGTLYLGLPMLSM